MDEVYLKIDGRLVYPWRAVDAEGGSHHVDKLLPNLRDGARLTDGLVQVGSRKGNELYDAIETILKGIEAQLPTGVSFLDKGGHRRHSVRTQWWNPTLITFKTACIGPGNRGAIPDLPLPEGFRIPEPDRPTFIGHYWFDPKATPMPASSRVACVDYSVANKGPLVAYRFDGESVLAAEKFSVVSV